MFLILKKYLRFIGPGLMVSVAYMDPGNYSTAVAAGAAYKYDLLFSILLSNCLAIFLQILAARLGAVTGLDLAANCRANLSPRLNLFIYILAEIAIIATDLAEVVGTAIALNILFGLPLAAGVVVTIVDVLVVLMAYRPKGPLLFIRIFELFVLLLVTATVVCFAIELYLVSNDSTIDFSWGQVLRGFLPNKLVVDMSPKPNGENGLYLSLAILGATVMPHSLYLGSGLVQLRLRDFDEKNGHWAASVPSAATQGSSPLAAAESADAAEAAKELIVDEYRPSVHAIKDTMTYTVVELVISLFTVALFVNAAILIVAGATFSPEVGADSPHFTRDNDTDDSGTDSDADPINQGADLFTIYNQLSKHLSPTVGFVFALALLCSGQSAGIVCTLAGQMVSEGFLSWSFPPIVRRLITRALAIAPCFAVVLFAGRDGLARTLNASQVVLSLMLPVVTAPLIYFTCSSSIMRVPIYENDDDAFVDVIYDPESETCVPENPSIASSRFHSLQPAIRLEELRKLHPCAGWEDDEDDDDYDAEYRRTLDSAPELLALLGPEQPSRPLIYSPHSQSASSVQEIQNKRIKGYKDYSNGRLAAAAAVFVWAFITLLNLYLIVSVL